MEERQEVSEQEMDIAAVLDVYVYTAQKGETYNNQTLATIVDGSTDEHCQSVKSITDNNPRIANMELLDQSSVSQPDAPYINNEYITACTFRDPVYDQGWVIIPREHTYFVETDFSLWPTNIVDCHDLRGMLDEDYQRI